LLRRQAESAVLLTVRKHQARTSKLHLKQIEGEMSGETIIVGGKEEARAEAERDRLGFTTFTDGSRS